METGARRRSSADGATAATSVGPAGQLAGADPTTHTAPVWTLEDVLTDVDAGQAPGDAATAQEAAAAAAEAPPDATSASVDKLAAKPDAAAQATDASPQPPAAPLSIAARAERALAAYFRRWGGEPGVRSPPLPHWADTVHAFIGTFASIAVVASVNYEALRKQRSDMTILMGSFGATAVILFATPRAPTAQPRNVVGGHTVSALIGVAVRVGLMEHLGLPAPVGCALAVSFSMAAMMVLGVVHPPGGATALTAVTGDDVLLRMGFMMVLVPAMSGAVIMVIVALVINNLRWHGSMKNAGQYPTYWW